MLAPALLLHDVAEVGAVDLIGLKCFGRFLAILVPKLSVDLFPDVYELHPVALTMIFESRSKLA